MSTACPQCDGAMLVKACSVGEVRATWNIVCPTCCGTGEASDAKIVTTHVYPPIPLRHFDWCAHDENYEPPDSDGVGGGIIGWGRTEAEAIADYRMLVEDDQ